MKKLESTRKSQIDDKHVTLLNTHTDCTAHLKENIYIFRIKLTHLPIGNRVTSNSLVPVQILGCFQNMQYRLGLTFDCFLKILGLGFQGGIHKSRDRSGKKIILLSSLVEMC